MTIKDFEAKVYAIEQIRIVVRASARTQVANYTFSNAAPQNWRVSEILVNRIQPGLNALEVVVVKGDGSLASGHMILKTVKESYL
jgi:hypothetical protein